MHSGESSDLRGGNAMSGRLTVLLVDDHAVVREGYRRLLEDSGRIEGGWQEHRTSKNDHRPFWMVRDDTVVFEAKRQGPSLAYEAAKVLRRWSRPARDGLRQLLDVFHGSHEMAL